MMMTSNKLVIHIVATTPVDQEALDQSYNNNILDNESRAAATGDTTATKIDLASKQHAPKKQHQHQTQQSQINKKRTMAIDPEIPCLHTITTAPLDDTSSILSAYGILFTISSPREITIASLGFYVDTTQLNNYIIGGGNKVLRYEVYTLSGYYADPNRTNGVNGGLPFTWDYRGDASTTNWKMIAEGSVDDLKVWPPTNNNNGDTTTGKANYFQIPLEEFQPTSMNSENGVQSFYVTLREVGALLIAPLEDWEDIHDEQLVWHCGSDLALLSRSNGGDGDDSITSVETIGNHGPTGCIPGNYNAGDEKQPILQIGEGVVSYPFPSMPYFYQPRKFMGSLYYINQCPTQAPSAIPSTTSIPSWSLVPSYKPTVAENMGPSNSQMPSFVPKDYTTPTTLSYIDARIDGCHRFISTNRQYALNNDDDNEAITISSSFGIVFPIQSNENDDDGVTITSFGFHVDFSAIPPSLDGDQVNTVNYEVYVLIANGMYADPNRVSNGIPETFDHRGDFSKWKSIAMGTIHREELGSNSDYFQIPWSNFEPTFVPPNGGIRSFYVTLDKQSAFVCQDLQRKQLGALQKDDDFKNNKDLNPHPPMLVYGEGVIGYPFHKASFLFSPKQFVGRVFYQYECPSEAPSMVPSLGPSEGPSTLPSVQPSQEPSEEPSSLPSSSPSMFPSSSPSVNPSVSHKPSYMPSNAPSTSSNPSHSPSIRPSASALPTIHEFPSGTPSVSITPSEIPSWHPTSSQNPSKSPRPSSQPSLGPSSAASCMSTSLSTLPSMMGALFLMWRIFLRY